MLINITVTWNDAHKIVPHYTEVVEVHERSKEDDYFLEGLLNQAMRQRGYSEKEIHAQNYVGPVKFVFAEKPPKSRTIAVPSTLAECRPDQVENWWAAYVSARGG